MGRRVGRLDYTRTCSGRPNEPYHFCAWSDVVSRNVLWGHPSPQEAIDLEAAKGLQGDKTELGCIVLQQFYKV